MAGILVRNHVRNETIADLCVVECAHEEIGPHLKAIVNRLEGNSHPLEEIEIQVKAHFEVAEDRRPNVRLI